MGKAMAPAILPKITTPPATAASVTDPKSADPWTNQWIPNAGEDDDFVQVATALKALGKSGAPAPPTPFSAPWTWALPVMLVAALLILVVALSSQQPAAADPTPNWMTRPRRA